MILEPIMSVEVNAPEEFQGSCISLITNRSGIMKSVEGSGDNWITIEAECPLNEMFGFSTELRSLTQGKGEYTMEYARYAPTVPETQDKIVEEYQNSLKATDSSKSGKKKSKN